MSCLSINAALGKGLQHLVRFLSIHLAFPHDTSCQMRDCAMGINVFSLPLQGWAVCDMFESTDLALQAFYINEVSERIISKDDSCGKTVAAGMIIIRRNALVFGLFLYHWIMGTLFQWWRSSTQNLGVQHLRQSADVLSFCFWDDSMHTILPGN